VTDLVGTRISVLAAYRFRLYYAHAIIAVLYRTHVAIRATQVVVGNVRAPSGVLRQVGLAHVGGARILVAASFMIGLMMATGIRVASIDGALYSVRTGRRRTGQAITAVAEIVLGTDIAVLTSSPGVRIGKLGLGLLRVAHPARVGRTLLSRLVAGFSNQTPPLLNVVVDASSGIVAVRICADHYLALSLLRSDTLPVNAPVLECTRVAIIARLAVYADGGLRLDRVNRVRRLLLLVVLSS